MELADLSDRTWAGRGSWEKQKQAAVWGEDSGFGFKCVGLAICARGDGGQVVGCISGPRRDVEAPGKMKAVKRKVKWGTLRVVWGVKSLGSSAVPGGICCPGLTVLREVIEFLLRRTDPVARREQMLHPPCLTLWPVLSWDFQRWLDFIFISLQ